MNKIRKGDQVVVTTGREKGKKGTVLRVLETGKVLVEGVNRVKKHQRPNPMKGQTGGIIDREMPIDLSNVMLVNPATGKGDRVGFRSTAALASNLITEPSGRRTPCAVRTTTALYTSPFFTRPRGAALLMLTLMMSPMPA